MISRQLRIALLISLFWHLFWMSFVTVIFLPAGFQRSKSAAVHFLGSILEQVVSAKPASLSAPEDFREFACGRVGSGRAPERPDAHLLVNKKAISPDSFIDPDQRTRRRSPLAVSFVAAQPVAQQRGIIFRPPLPKYPEWAQQETRASTAVFKIYISAEGLVDESICTQGSGNPEIDTVLARYISSWRFAPVVGAQTQPQTVKISLEIDGSIALVVNPDE